MVLSSPGAIKHEFSTVDRQNKYVRARSLAPRYGDIRELVRQKKREDKVEERMNMGRGTGYIPLTTTNVVQRRCICDYSLGSGALPGCQACMLSLLYLTYSFADGLLNMYYEASGILHNRLRGKVKESLMKLDTGIVKPRHSAGQTNRV